MNTVDTLLKSPFSTLSLAEKLQVKRLDAHQPHDIKLYQQCNKQCFSTSWFERKSWLTISEEKKISILFCVSFVWGGGWNQVVLLRE
ncbi:hypothetical protein C0J52_02330 [Blattella germanica]|nr:hypothetical protein C0J52_02330 [Blattella germanica]